MLFALITFCLVATVTPGPNNMMLLSSGATFGLRRTVPHIFGISAGCVIMVFVVGWGIGGIAKDLPRFYLALQIAASVYLLWLAWRIAQSTGPDRTDPAARPLGFVGAAAFQWVNPKAWAMVVGAVATFARPERIWSDILIIATVLFVVGIPSITLWALGGSMLQRVLQRPVLLRAFNWIMAGLLILSLVPGWLDVLGNAQQS